MLGPAALWGPCYAGGLPAAHPRVAPRGAGAAPGRPLVGALPVLRGVGWARMATNCTRATPPHPHPRTPQHNTARHGAAQHPPHLLPKNQPTTLPSSPSLRLSYPKTSPQPYPTLPASTTLARQPAHDPTELSLALPLLLKTQPKTFPNSPSLRPCCPKTSPQRYPTLPPSAPPALRPTLNPPPHPTSLALP